MSKVKLLIHEVFRLGKEGSGRDTKNGIALYLSLYFSDALNFEIADRTLVRYYDAYIAENGTKVNIEPYKLDKLSQYVGYRDFSDFSRTSIKTDENANSTTVRISVDKDEEAIAENLSNININITNEQHFKMPEFMKKNGMGIMEIALLICLVTGNVLFSNNKKVNKDYTGALGFMSMKDSSADKKYMYWNGERYIGTDSSYIRPGLTIIAMNRHDFMYFRKIMRKDTLTDQNAAGKTWYSKYNNEVEFFTDDGVDPDTGKELRRSTSWIIFKYAGKHKDSIEVEE